MNRRYYLVVIFIFLFSCKVENVNSNDNTYAVLSILYNRLAVRIPTPFPPLKKGITKEDSLEIVQKVKNHRKNREGRKSIIAIDPYLSSIKNIEINNQELNADFKKLISKLNSFKERKSFDVSRIETNRNDSIIEFNDSLIEKDIKDYLNFDKRINFSRIAFNEDQTLAAVVGTSATSSLAGQSSLYFLKKENGQWNVIKVIILSIS